MRYLALATDYDGTLTREGRVADGTLAALGRLRRSGRRLVLVTGRELDELLAIFPAVELFERVVAENGALLYRPAAKEQKVLAPPPPAAFVEALRQRGVRPLSVGRSIVATLAPQQAVVEETLRRLGVDWHVVHNKDSLMVLPGGIDKATGLAVALAELGLAPEDTVGVGDAENDLAFLACCGCAVAVANALPAVREAADLVTRGSEGAGVVEVIDRLLQDDLAGLPARRRHPLPADGPAGTQDAAE
jgi:HAD superfamily hydrolase (TIGR01484 family)